MKLINLVFLSTCLLVGASSCGGGGGGERGSGEGAWPTTVYVVRHAEKAAPDGDPPLSEAGVRRAEALAAALERARVDAIYSTQFVRNRETVGPIAQRAGVAVTEMPVELGNPGDYGKRLAAEILEKHRHGSVAVVGHQNTVPQIVEALSGQTVPPLGDAEYATMYVVVVAQNAPARVVKAQYGQPDGQ